MTKQIEQTYKVVVNEYSTSWYQDGQLHRVDGPAVENANGEKYWYLNGQLHREDGPAVVHANGIKYWYLNGENLSETDFNAKQTASCNNKIVEIDGKKYQLVSVD